MGKAQPSGVCAASPELEPSRRYLPLSGTALVKPPQATDCTPMTFLSLFSPAQVLTGRMETEPLDGRASACGPAVVLRPTDHGFFMFPLVNGTVSASPCGQGCAPGLLPFPGEGTGPTQVLLVGQRPELASRIGTQPLIK